MDGTLRSGALLYVEHSKNMSERCLEASLPLQQQSKPKENVSP